jgi:CRP/FNR family transcriptional regulator, cyclic AMP receptor protein
VGLLHKDAKVELMRRVPLFAACSKRDLAAIAGIADELDLPPAKVLIREGERGREFFVLAEGDVEVRMEGRVIATLHEGSFFGEMALVSSAPRNATVTAKTPVKVLVVTERAFSRLLRESPEIRDKVLHTVSERLMAAEPAS